MYSHGEVFVNNYLQASEKTVYLIVICIRESSRQLLDLTIYSVIAMLFYELVLVLNCFTILFMLPSNS